MVYNDKPSIEDALIHFGKKGMKWGVRNEGDRSTDSRSQRRQSKKALNRYVVKAAVGRSLFYTRGMTPKEYEALSTKGQTFAKGTTLKRIDMRIRSAEVKINKGTMYVAKLESDATFYTASFPSIGFAAEGMGRGGRKSYKNPGYAVELTTLKKLSIPSDKERFDAFYDILKEPTIKMQGRIAPITGRQYLEENGYGKLLRNPSDQQLAFKSYHSFVQGQGNKDAPLNKPYFEKLQARGFNALVDGNDAGYLTKNPLIIIDAKGTVRVKSVRQLTANEINKAQRDLAKRPSDA